jgi:GNAT superfamily N-acetyltransferase
MTDDLTASWLMRLMGDGLYMMVQCSDRLRARMVPGAWLVLSGAPFADLNCMVISGGDDPAGTFEEFVGEADRANIPFLAMLGPEVSKMLAPVAERLGMVHATVFPFMVCPGESFEVVDAPGIEIVRVENASQMAELADPMGAAFKVDVSDTRRVLPFEVVQGPLLDGWIARIDGRPVGCTVTTIHGDYVGIWAMGTHPDHQRKGIGHALLTHAMEHHRRRGAPKAYFLGATPSGQPLYRKIGYVTRLETRVWLRGETSQA